MPGLSLVCDFCGRVFPVSENRVLCECGGLLHVEAARASVSWETLRSRRFRLWRYRELIPLPPGTPIVSLDEGGSPLVQATRLSEELKVNVMVKLEGSNPTGSFKDRGMTVAASMAKFLGAKALIAASTGNTAASMSAYARRAGMIPVVLIPSGKIAEGKLGQLRLYGAVIVEVEGGFDEAMGAVLEYSVRGGDAYTVNSINPWRIEGQKTAAFEVADEAGAPGWVAVPVGNGGNIYSIWKGFKELKELDLIDELPRMLGVQAEGAAPIAKAYTTKVYEPIKEPKTIASAIRIGNPVHWKRVLNTVRESGGSIVSVSDEEIIWAQRTLARLEGLGVESSSAVTLAGLKKAINGKLVDKNEKIVLIATGNALKEPQTMNLHETATLKIPTLKIADTTILSEILKSITKFESPEHF